MKYLLIEVLLYHRLVKYNETEKQTINEDNELTTVFKIIETCNFCKFR